MSLCSCVPFEAHCVEFGSSKRGIQCLHTFIHAYIVLCHEKYLPSVLVVLTA